MLLMIEKEIRGGLCHSFNRFAKACSKYMKDYDKNKESLYLKYWDVNNLYGWAMWVTSWLDIFTNLMKVS